MAEKQINWSHMANMLAAPTTNFNPAAGNGYLPIPKRNIWEKLMGKPGMSLSVYETNQPCNDDNLVSGRSMIAPESPIRDRIRSADAVQIHYIINLLTQPRVPVDAPTHWRLRY